MTRRQRNPSAFALAIGGSRTLIDSVVGGFNLVRINGNVVLNNSSSLTLKGAAGDTVMVDIAGNLGSGTNSRSQLSRLSPNRVVIKVRGTLSSWVILPRSTAPCWCEGSLHTAKLWPSVHYP